MGKRLSTNRLSNDNNILLNDEYYLEHRIISFIKYGYLKVSMEKQSSQNIYSGNNCNLEHKILNDGILNKTLLIYNDKNKLHPLIIKIFSKSNYTAEDHELYKKEVEKIRSIQKKILSTNNLNVAPMIDLVDDLHIDYRDHGWGVIARHYVKYNLKERFYLMPDLTYIEKIWITFQLLVAVNNLTSLDIIHGDLKPENILLTSNLSVYISDFGIYKPAYISFDDIGSYTYFFGSNKSSDIRGCYLAPERLIEKGENKNNIKTFSMDVFSLGVIIAELFLEENLFNFSSLLNYKRGNKKLFNIEETLNKIKNDKIRNLIYNMIKINPNERISISEALNYFTNEICPIGIKGFIFHFNTMINSTNFWKPDLIIGHIYRNWIPIWKILLGPDSFPALLYRHLNLEIANEIILHDPFYRTNSTNSVFVSNENNELFVYNFKLNFHPQKRNLLPELLENKTLFQENNNKDCIYIIINYLLEAMQNCKYDSSILVAMEMVLNLSKTLEDISKLKIIIPYFMNNLRKKNYTIKISSLNYIFELLYSIDYNNLILPVTEFNYFHVYIFPFLIEQLCQNNDLVLEFLNNLEKIIELENIFLNITLKSRILRIKKNEKEEAKKSKKMNLISEAFDDFHNSLEYFKNELLTIVNDIMGNRNEIDLLKIIISKIHFLIKLFGKNKSDELDKIILNIFNKSNWQIQKEILIQIPKMLPILGRDYLLDYLMPCIESFFSNNSNEFKIAELIKTINKFLEMGYLLPGEVTKVFIELIPFCIHPNKIIHNHMMNLLNNILGKIPQDDFFSYLYNPINKYMDIPLLENNFDNINNGLVKNLSRVRYQLELENIDYEIFNNYECTKICPLMKDFIELLKKGNSLAFDDRNEKNNLEIKTYSEDNIEIEYNNNYFYNSEYIRNILEKKLDSYKKNSLIEPLEKYIKKEISKSKQWVGEDMEAKIFSRIYCLSDLTENYEIPHFTNNIDFPFEDNGNGDNIISKDPFKITYIIKTLGISMKLVKFQELLKDKKNDDAINDINIKIKYLYNYNNSQPFNDWRPKGKIISTLYGHNSIPLEKIIPMKGSNFCSFDQMGNAIIYNITPTENEDMVDVEKIWEFNCQKKFPIKYKNVFSSLDNLTFVIGSENNLVQYFPNRSPSLNEKSNILCQTIDNSDITCLKAFGVDSVENQKIIFCSRNNYINIFDQRINKVSLYKKISKEKGIFNCLCDSFEKNKFYIGSLDGNLLCYDLRMNDIINEYKYNENVPILGINLYYPNKDADYDLENFDKNSNYVILWTGNDEHEISFWNYNDSSFINCDLLLTVNSFNSEDNSQTLPIEIPSISTKQNIYNIKNPEYNELKNNLNYLDKLSTIYNTNFSKSILTSTLENDYDYFLNMNLSKMSNFYENYSTVQCVAAPLGGRSEDGSYQNTPYIISGGNDMTIRYWDFSKENDIYNQLDISNDEKNKSYIINTLNNISYCKFIKTSFNGTDIIQSNEEYNYKKKKKQMKGLSECQYSNGIYFHAMKQNEFDPSEEKLKFCTKLSDASHKSIITDLLPFRASSQNNKMNLLISSSWDGTIKIWK